MSKIRALNEDGSSSESEDEPSRKVSKEAQEELAKLSYNGALKTLGEGRRKEACELFEKLLDNSYIFPNSDETKLLTPFQQQLQLGCLKILGDLYKDGELKDLERAKSMYERAIGLDQDDNINLWYRLGKVSYEVGDLYIAYGAFGHALSIRPSHWGCLEHMITVSYATQDYIGCLNYCAAGLAKDSGFVKGLVYRDLIYNILPELKEYAKTQIKHPDALNAGNGYENAWKDKYQLELKRVQSCVEERIFNAQQICKPSTPKVRFDFKLWSIVELIENVLTAYESIRDTSDFHTPVELSWVKQDSSTETDDTSKPAMTEESQTEEESQSCLRRSRSSSDDKENAAAMPSDAGGNQDQSPEKRTVENGSESSQPLDPQSQNTAEEENTNNKKNNKRGAKWWQMAVKRRSQRVRGHLMPLPQDKAKKENSFSDQLKNLIPPSLLGDDGSISERESAKASEKSTWQKKMNPVNFFGSKEEELQVKRMLNNLNGRNMPGMVILVIHFLTSVIKYAWQSELREQFLSLYKHYRSHVILPNDVHNCETSQILKYAYACVSLIEIVTEKYKFELSSGDSSFLLKLIDKEMYFLDECVMPNESMPLDLILRIKWFTVRRYLQLASASVDEQANQNVSEILADMEAQLKKEPITVWTVNENSNLICLESVHEKAAGIAKMQNSQTVSDLYSNKDYETLIGVLKSCINFSEIEKRDLSDIMYYTVSLFRTNRSECIHQCLNLINQAIRFQENSILSESLVLLEEIWEVMKAQFRIQDKRSAVGCLLKILVSCESKPPNPESVLALPWCILHSVLFSMEREEPALYLEEDSVPNSILLLQMAHECMSRSEKCCVNNGKLLLYIMKAILQMKKLEEYFGYEETRHCMEQAIYCLYQHPSKKSKVKNLKDHNSPGITLTWQVCPLLFHYYCPDELPEFDSYGSIGTETEVLYQRLLEIMPSELKPTSRQLEIQLAIDKAEDLKDVSRFEPFPTDFQDIYFLIGDYHFKSKEWTKAVIHYTFDLAVNPSRFDAWAAIALSLGENINTILNTADVIDFKDLLAEAQSTAFCFNNALKLQPLNIKLRIEFGSFVYAMHAYCSRLMKNQASMLDMELFRLIEKARNDFLQNAFKCFAPIAKKEQDANDSSETVEDELWIHHYMLGKIYEKMLFEDEAKEFLSQYELAGKLLHDQGAPYPAKMNYYSPPELAIEALEIYYRIHATILSLVEKSDYSPTAEKAYLELIRRQENSPFVKSKQTKGDGGDGRKGKKGNEDVVSKKDMAEIQGLLNDLITQAETLAQSSIGHNSESSSLSSSSTDESSSSSIQSDETSKPTMSSFSLSEFKKRLHEKELREEKLATEAVKLKQKTPSPPPSPDISENIYESFQLDTNHFYNDFKDVKFGAVVALCLKAMEECISRYPSHFKSYYRLAQTYVVLLKDAKTAKDYLMGSPTLSAKKIAGLFGERKSTNFFNGIWRNPIDDIDRPGSFSYHMNKTMQLLLDVLTQLNDHQLLADIVVQLAKVPDNEKKYLSNPDRELFCQQAFNAVIASVKRKQQEATGSFHELGLEVYESYTKLQKHNPRLNPLSTTLHEIYRTYLKSTGVNDDSSVTVDHAVRYFSLQAMTLKANAKPVGGKGNASSQSYGDQSRDDGPTSRKRGRRALRQASQELAPVPSASSQELDIFNAVAAAFKANQGASLTPLLGVGSTGSLYPTMNVDAVHSAINPLLNLNADVSTKSMVLPPPAHDSSRNPMPYSKVMHAGVPPKKYTVMPTPMRAHASSEYAVDNQAVERAESNAMKDRVVQKQPPKPKLQEGKKPTSQFPSNSSKYPAMPPLQPMPLGRNTSPYKTQNTMVEQPYSYSKQKQNSTSAGSSNRGTAVPPLAHTNTSSKPRVNAVEPEDVVEIIDLTMKTPEKDPPPPPPPSVAGSSKTVLQPKPAMPNHNVIAQKRAPAYPLPPKKKHQQMLFREAEPRAEQKGLPDDVEVIILE